MERENQKTQSSPTHEAPSTGGLTMAPPALQLQAQPVNAPAQLQQRSIRDFPIVQIRTTEAAVEGTQEFQAFMDSTSTYQTVLRLTRDEARVACLLMVEAFHNGENVDMAARGTEFANQARARLNPAANAGPVARLGMEIGQVSPQRAQELFNQLAGLRFTDSNGQSTPVPFHYPPDGCYARAHLMSERLTALGIESHKQFAVSTRAGGLSVASDYAPDVPLGNLPVVNWWYHVAPILAVTQPDGTVVEMVMDPSMFSTPVPVSQWTGAMRPDQFNVMSVDAVRAHVQQNGGRYGAGENITYSTDRDDFYPQQHDNVPNPQRAQANMDGVRARLTQYAVNAQAHELAAVIRGQMRSGRRDMNAVIAQVQRMTMAGKQYYQNQFRSLASQWWPTLSQQEQQAFIAVW